MSGEALLRQVTQVQGAIKVQGSILAEEKQGEELTFEQALALLEGVVKRLEEGEISLEESLRLFQEGVRLSQLCERKLDEAERQLEQLVEDINGVPRTEPFSLEASDQGA